MREQTAHHLVADENVKAAQRLIEHKQGGSVRQSRRRRTFICMPCDRWPSF
jgi:hypothetical protein